MSSHKFDLAALRGDLPSVQAFHRYGVKCTKKAMDWAAMEGHLPVVEFLHKNRREGCTSDAVNKAAEFGHLPVVEFLMTVRKEAPTKEAMNGAAANGHEKVLRFLFATASLAVTRKLSPSQRKQVISTVSFSSSTSRRKTRWRGRLLERPRTGMRTSSTFIGQNVPEKVLD